MSDVAVTWAKAQTCTTAAGKPDRNAKQVLVHMASYADAAGEAWVLVGVLALEMDVEERTVQRGKQALLKAGLLIDTGTTRVHRGRRVPIYRLPLETGHASTIRRIHAEREAVLSTGDTGVTPSESHGCHPCHPTPDANVTPRGDTGVTQIGKGITQDETHGVRASASAVDQVWSAAFEGACDAWAGKAPERVSPSRSWTAWVAAVERTELSEADLSQAVLAAVARDPDFGRGKAMNLDRWLTEDRFRGWLTTGGTKAGPVTPGRWDGPGEVRAAVVSAIGEAGTVSYLDTASWDAVDRIIRCRTGFGADRLRRDAGRALAPLNLTIQGPAASSSQQRNAR